LANPLATLLSTAMMLDWLGHPETRRAADAVRKAVTEVLTPPRNRTADLGGRMSTTEMGGLVAAAAARLLSS
jgi:3-isopropylmalate dehydrogenase